MSILSLLTRHEYSAFMYYTDHPIPEDGQFWSPNVVDTLHIGKKLELCSLAMVHCNSRLLWYECNRSAPDPSWNWWCFKSPLNLSMNPLFISSFVMVFNIANMIERNFESYCYLVIIIYPTECLELLHYYKFNVWDNVGCMRCFYITVSRRLLWSPEEMLSTG